MKSVILAKMLIALRISSTVPASTLLPDRLRQYDTLLNHTLRCFLRHPVGEDAADASLPHRDAVPRGSRLHRRGVVGDEQELTFRAELFDEIRELLHVGAVERGVHFVEEHERTWLHGEEGEEEGGRGEGAFSAGEEGEALRFLARRLCDDFDARL